MKRLAAPLFASFLLALLAGCGNPTAGVAGLNAALVRLERDGSGAVQAVVRFTNPNVYSYAIDRSEHRVFLGGTLAGTVKFDRPFAVPTQQAIEQTAAFVPAGPAPAVAEAVPYRVESVIIIRTYGDDTQTWKNGTSGTIAVVAK